MYGRLAIMVQLPYIGPTQVESGQSKVFTASGQVVFLPSAFYSASEDQNVIMISPAARMNLLSVVLVVLSAGELNCRRRFCICALHLLRRSAFTSQSYPISDLAR